ncbi:nucleotidyl transferase AbiEii/AbiGii toxin family protein [Longispora fulva]|uniref:Nucleotidyltransferase AbiEii toxin of type IV toxin-antitoxin system n=1 Tax=Longispora fulva TaxID=619741 RepID=A0A8J7GDB5_9ACTN|nr:nucleotidyl transferase AbiEii/AbiGii toxin family protein [Longispora fulva]MBG6136539.1 hypothetical protein [Longispora fulva]
MASIALTAIGPLGFALGGGNALMIHGLIDRPTHDVDLMVDEEGAVAAAVEAVETALRDAGLTVERLERETNLSDWFEGFELELADWAVTDPSDGQVMQLQIAHIGRRRDTVTMDVGPVLALEDALGSKVCALAGRAELRDYFDVAAALGRFSVDELIALARDLDPGLGDEDFADIGDRLDATDDEDFVEEFGLAAADIAALRARFTAWPRA